MFLRSFHDIFFQVFQRKLKRLIEFENSPNFSMIKDFKLFYPTSTIDSWQNMISVFL